ncbi:MAG: hypothetical protein M0Q13_13040 [Methanothrix sp.]|jgi:hypothetical protein|nr:hypothetical protein [Methanothrix sp.]
MATEIPTGIEFQHLMSHTFPGFFSAITMFMLIDLWSEIDLASIVSSDLTGLFNFIGFILLIGTMLGVIIDGLHHSLIENAIFDKMPGMQEMSGIRNEIMIKCKKSKKDLQTLGLTHHYFFRILGDKSISLWDHFAKGYYCYSEFYSNTFIALVPFSIIVPFYISKTFCIDWKLAVLIGVFALSLGCICLRSSYITYKLYYGAMLSSIYGYLDEVKQ